jgi:Arc/MetJ-type ribon-helix-helix transcriptional regulator
LNVILRGKVKEIVESAVAAGYANTQSEAIRLAIIKFGEEHLDEIELVNKKLDKFNQEVKEGKRRLLGPEEALGKYAKLLK